MKPAIEFRGIDKSFDGFFANKNLHFQVKQGSIHAIVGENGAGKSTAMKILYGTFEPDQGEVYLNGLLWGGRNRPWSSPSDAIRFGIGMVHQHFMLSGPYTALENIVLGSEPHGAGSGFLPRFLRPIDFQAARRKLEALILQYGLKVDLDAKIEDTSVGIQQRIEILKLLYRNANILILDEPTAVLTPQETEELFVHLRKLRDQGKTILIITHKLKEVMKLASRVTVFRRGKVAAEREIEQTSIEDLACLMVGRKVNLNAHPRQSVSPILSSVPSKPVLQVKNLNLFGRCSLKQVNFSVHSGEIVGIAGVEGNGQSELLDVLLHAKDYGLSSLASQGSASSGGIEILGHDTAPLSAWEIRSLGVGFIPEDRHREGLLLEKSVRDNFLLGLQRRPGFHQQGVICWGSLNQKLDQVLEEHDIRPRSKSTTVSHLSGGNQQKLIIARELEVSPQFLIAAQPTRGVDVGAIEAIHERLLAARDRGCGILLVSSELDELLALSDRILVLYEGQIRAEFQRSEVSEEKLGLYMGGSQVKSLKDHAATEAHENV
ncbi:MAG: ABC transporter ATP-binding protein [Bdellovibrionia bacterium]